jgi:hypothetical protein
VEEEKRDCKGGSGVCLNQSFRSGVGFLRNCSRK